MHRPIQTFTYTGGTTPQTVQSQMWLAPSVEQTGTYLGQQTIDNSDPNPGVKAGNYSPPVMPFSSTTLPTAAGATPQPNVLWGEYSQGFCIDPIGRSANIRAAAVG